LTNFSLWFVNIYTLFTQNPHRKIRRGIELTNSTLTTVDTVVIKKHVAQLGINPARLLISRPGSFNELNKL
jgi:hypothetical protein